MTVVKSWVIAVALLAAPAAGYAQPAARATDTDTIRARQKISLIEGLFERAVQNGVDNFSRQLQAVAPNADGMAMLMGAPLVRGFRLADVGIFFDVQMPSLQLSMMFPLRYSQGADLATAASLADIRATLERTSLDPQTRVDLTNRLRQIESQLAGGAAVRRRTGGATQVANVQGTAAVPPASPADMAILDDPADAWRREVRSTLTDALIEIPGSVTIGPSESIYIAARGVLSSDRLVADPGDARTIELRLKGSDLLAFRSGSITLEEARKRVEFREY